MFYILVDFTTANLPTCQFASLLAVIVVIQLFPNLQSMISSSLQTMSYIRNHLQVSKSNRHFWNSANNTLLVRFFSLLKADLIRVECCEIDQQ